MGDLRNKFMKQARDEAHREFMARRYPPKPARPTPRCQCGLTWDDVPVMWSVEVQRWPYERALFCPACIPAQYLHLVAVSAANTPD
jgi:hypothetical protein